MSTTTANLTPLQADAYRLICREPYRHHARSLACELDLARSQDAGRVIAALERAGLIEFSLAPEGHDYLGGLRVTVEGELARFHRSLYDGPLAEWLDREVKSGRMTHDLALAVEGAA